MRSKTTLRTAFLIYIVAGALPVAAPFEEYYTLHQREGTLLAMSTLVQVRQHAWEWPFRDALLRTFRGQAAGGVELSVSVDASTRPRVGALVQFKFSVTNRSAKPVHLVTGGSCRTVHGAVYTLLQPDRHIYGNLGRGLDGGRRPVAPRIVKRRKSGAADPR